jgi:cell division protein FtsI (penicillin-binding protein 3)
MRISRFTAIAVFLGFWSLLISAQLVRLQVFQHKHWVEEAAKIQRRGSDVAPRRGLLYDRNLTELAMTVQLDSIFAVPSEVGENRAEWARILSTIIHKDPADSFTSQEAILARLNNAQHFAWVAHRVDAETAQRIRELNLQGIHFQSEPKRFYPNGDLGAQVLGYVGAEDNGLAGIEKKYDEYLQGTKGKMSREIDAKQQAFSSVVTPSSPGENLVLSIDANIQFIAERALDAQMQKVKAAHGTVVVQDPHTGQILALAEWPRFNPNDPHSIKEGTLQDAAVSNPFEPGSTFKLVTYASALDAAGVQPTDLVDCEGGTWVYRGRAFHDDKDDHMHTVTVQRALEKSSDIGAAKIAMKVPPARFYQYMQDFGFGDRSGIELPSETRGLVRPPKLWGETSILSLAIGHELMVTPIQLASMVSSIANGGTYLPPRLLLQSTPAMKGDPNLKPIAFHAGHGLPNPLPPEAHRVIREETAARMRAMMQGIVLEGTGTAATLNGYSSGGKTGTAQKIDPVTHSYSHNHSVASFVGISPVSDPAITIVVVIDDPTWNESRYGSKVSAPVFAEVAQETLQYLGVPHDQPVKTKSEIQNLRASAQDSMDGGTEADSANLAALYAERNNLPADDPLRNPAKPADAPALSEQSTSSPAVPTLTAFHPQTNTTSQLATEVPQNISLASLAVKPKPPTQPTDGVAISSSRQVAVPVFVGQGLRTTVEHAVQAGLRLQPVGSGIAREQVPAAGTMVPEGTEVVVRFAR